MGATGYKQNNRYKKLNTEKTGQGKESTRNPWIKENIQVLEVTKTPQAMQRLETPGGSLTKVWIQ